MNYDPNISWGIHKIKVTLQQRDYKGTLIVEVRGNVKGKFAIEEIELFENNILENNCEFQLFDDENGEGFGCKLKNDKGDVCELEEEWDELYNLIIGVEIIDFTKEEKLDRR